MVKVPSRRDRRGKRGSTITDTAEKYPTLRKNRSRGDEQKRVVQLCRNRLGNAENRRKGPYRQAHR